MPKKDIVSKEQKKIVDTILGGEVDVGANHPDHNTLKAVVMKGEETIRIRNPITMKESDVVISRNGTTEEKLAMMLLAPDATKEQKESMLAGYLFERGKESSSFLAELFVSKGTHLKETQAFKRNMRFDFEMFADKIVGLFQDMASDIQTSVKKEEEPSVIFENIAGRLEKGAELITSQRERITEARMRDKGFGIYINKDGKSFSIFEDEIEEAVKNDKADIKKDDR